MELTIRDITETIHKAIYLGNEEVEVNDKSITGEVYQQGNMVYLVPSTRKEAVVFKTDLPDWRSVSQEVKDRTTRIRFGKRCTCLFRPVDIIFNPAHCTLGETFAIV